MAGSDRRIQTTPVERDRDIRLLLAVMSTETKLIRARHLLQKYSRDQPRAPAGQSDGGRWIPPDGGSGGGPIDRLPRGGSQWASLTADASHSSSSSRTEERTLTADGGEVLSIRIRSGRAAFDEQHTVVTPDGESRIFENSGETQTIRDGRTGKVLSHSTFAADRAVSDATIQPAFLPAVPFVVAPAVAATIEAAAMLFTFLAARSAGFGEEPGSIAMRYDFEPDPKKEFPVVWVGKVDQPALDQYCPHNQEVQTVTDDATERQMAVHSNLDKTRLGSLIHLDIGKTFLARGYPEIKVEFSLDKAGGDIADYGARNSVRLDLYELAPDQMVCVYDPKTSKEGLRPERALVLARTAKRHFPTARGIIMIQVRPRLRR